MLTVERSTADPSEPEYGSNAGASNNCAQFNLLRCRRRPFDSKHSLANAKQVHRWNQTSKEPTQLTLRFSNG